MPKQKWVGSVGSGVFGMILYMMEIEKQHSIDITIAHDDGIQSKIEKRKKSTYEKKMDYTIRNE